MKEMHLLNVNFKVSIHFVLSSIWHYYKKVIYFNSLNFISTEQINDEIDLCNPSPCGPNAICNNGECTCLPEYQGDPFFECRPECVLNSDCPQDKACQKNKCTNPCLSNACAANAICEVFNHVAMCRCPERMTGNAFVLCSHLEGTLILL